MPGGDQMERLRLRVEGRVQGVGFRYFTRSAARSLNLTGWVCNERDGTVRVIAEGPRVRLEHLLRQVRQGPGTARVERAQAEWAAATGEFVDFSVR